MRFWMIFSSMSARTLMLAVCRGGPDTSFFSHFLDSESWKQHSHVKGRFFLAFKQANVLVLYRPHPWYELHKPLANTGHSYTAVSSMYLAPGRHTQNKNVVNTTKYFTLLDVSFSPSRFCFYATIMKSSSKHSWTVAKCYNVYTRVYWPYTFYVKVCM